MPKKKDLSIPENLKEEFTKTAISNLSFSLLQRDDEALDDLGTLLGVLYEPDLSDQERNLSSRIDRLSKTMKT